MNSKIKWAISIAIVAVIIFSSVFVFIENEPLKISQNSAFLRSSNRYSSMQGYGPYIYQIFNVSTGGKDVSIALTQLEFAGYRNSHSIKSMSNFTFNPREGFGLTELGEAFNLILISNSSQSLGFKILSVELYNRTITYYAPILEVTSTNSVSDSCITFDWLFPNDFSVNPFFNYTMIITIQLYQYLGPFYLNSGTYDLNASHFPISINYSG